MTKKHLLAIAALTCAFAPVAKAQSTFPDVPDNHWAAEAVKSLADAGIVVGRPASSAQEKASKEQEDQAAFITPRVKTALGQERILSDTTINVTAFSKNKRLILSGSTKNAQQKQVASQIARKNAVGWTLINNLKIQPNR